MILVPLNWSKLWQKRITLAENEYEDSWILLLRPFLRTIACNDGILQILKLVHDIHNVNIASIRQWNNRYFHGVSLYVTFGIYMI